MDGGIVTGHNGHIDLRSPREGDQPFDIVRVGPDLSEPAEVEKAKVGATILFVEDESTIREMATVYLEGSGYRVFDASDGLQAITLWEKHEGEIDLVVTDWKMPGGVNGHQLVERLKADRPDLKAIFISGCSADVIRESTPGESAPDFLQKPYRLKNLADIVHDCLARAHAA